MSKKYQSSGKKMLERWETEHKKESILLQNQFKVTALRMTYRDFVCYYLLYFAGRRGRRPLQKFFCLNRANEFMPFKKLKTREMFASL